jgi:hypothetical protein
MHDQETHQDPAEGAANSIRFEVHGKPPLKGEAISVFNAKHGQADRIRALLQAAQRACEEHGFTRIDKGNVALDVITLDVITRSPAGDAANIKYRQALLARPTASPTPTATNCRSWSPEERRRYVPHCGRGSQAAIA